ncbi:DNA helicase IV [Nocardioides thalensis]|uniref:DNA helicase IV n=1 Tax=Nocardioides thalensis TaxID=1914755 RepID=A0A853C5Y4_9ACTN|nr:AAA family ATPase [Nocardioides thalensis]NYJ02426.1 DNA helicase IV [Nocardioides thalensis]
MTTHPDLPYEQAKNKEYLAKLEKKLQRNPLADVERNVLWIDAVDHQIKANGFHHPLLGRVGCDSDDEELRDFYIGSRFIQDGDVQVYSWAAPIARLFFQPESEGSEDVVVRRTFTHRLTDVSDLDDDWAREGADSPFTARALSVPVPAPGRSTRRRVTPAPAGSSTPTDAEPSSPIGSAERGAAALPATTKARTGSAADIREGMRAQDAVLKRLAAPREDKLQSVLALLQPDQHALVSWPVDESVVVQGHPGTGKTVVAAYRASYLVNPALYEQGGALAGRATKPLRVLVVGPTPGYVAHVEGLIKPLAASEQVRVTHLADLMAETTGLKGPWPGAIGGEHDDVDAQARNFAERAARIFESNNRWREGNGARRENIRQVYELIRSNGTPGRPLVEDVEQISWMRKLPPFDQAFKRRYLPLMAQCRLAYSPIPDALRFDHIIVDEAQDVSPIEWNVLDHYLRREGRWTLVGDMNQRRSDVTYGSWSEIADHLALTADGEFQPQKMTRGYRSTGAVLRFADRLLPAKHRGNQTVQATGESVAVRRAPRPNLVWTTALQTARDLATKHADGSTAIITVNPGEMIGELGRSGWRRKGSGFHVWQKDNLSVRLFPPEDARGLEFDAVVVVEPGDFPENLGRTGQLYTSLTRANRELAVVWYRNMPDALRRAARS